MLIHKVSYYSAVNKSEWMHERKKNILSKYPSLPKPYMLMKPSELSCYLREDILTSSLIKIENCSIKLH